jgi:glycine/D-amino acid oxidase-like deaminating enzyme
MDVTPDGLPVISRVDAVPGLVVGTGFSGHGFGLGPGAGRVLADIATGRDPAVDVAPFRFSRFSDGTPLLPGLRF